MALELPQLPSRPLADLSQILGDPTAESLAGLTRELRDAPAGRTVWNVTASRCGDCVTDLVRSIVTYGRGAGSDVRWCVIDGPPEFFELTKDLHDSIQGVTEAAESLASSSASLYEEVLHQNAAELAAGIRPGDLVLLHDPETAGLVPHLHRAGARVLWHCHVGCDGTNAAMEHGWSFLEPYLEEAAAFVFTRSEHVPWCCGRERSVVIPPGIDPLSPKNQALSDAACRAILVQAGIVEGPAGDAPLFTRADGSPARVGRGADVQRLGRAPDFDAPLVLQLARWDSLKDPVGVVQGFALALADLDPAAQLVIAGPNVNAVAADPGSPRVYDQVCETWRSLPHSQRRRVHLVSLPMRDVEENAALVNALQRHATIVVQKSLREGFGLAVTEAMWKSRPVLASAVGGLQDQIEDGVHGMLLKAPDDLASFASALSAVLSNRELATRLGQNAHAKVRSHYLATECLRGYAGLWRRVVEEGGRPRP